MIENFVKDKLKRGEVSLGSWIQLGSDPGVAEILSYVGFDWIALDWEHSAAEPKEIASLVRCLSNKNCVPMVRVKNNETLTIRRALDMGAKGIIVPLVNSAEDARKAVAAAKYPPIGIRGFAFCKANEYGEEFDDYAKRANDEILVVAMIETKEGVENIDDILAIDGIDGVFIGPYDLSGSFGIPGQLDSGCVKEACKKVVASCLKKGKFAGEHIVTPTKGNVGVGIKEGFTFIALGMDTVFLQQSAKNAIKYAKEALNV